jgi:hypothetical protein
LRQMAKTFEQKSNQRMSPKSGWSANRKLRAKVGEFDMANLEGSEARPGAWRKMLTDKRTRDVPTVLEDKIVEETANGALSSELEEQLGLNQGTVRRVLTRRFGGVAQMKEALKAQCFENAIIFNDHASTNVDRMAPGQAAVAAKIMIDGGLALERSHADAPATIDFEAFQALGETLHRVERKLTQAEAHEV